MEPVFFKDKYNPRTIDDTQLSIFQMKTHLIINGPPGSGKMTRALAMINGMHNNNGKVYKIKYKEHEIGDTTFVYGESEYHLELTPTSFGTDDKNIMVNFVAEKIANVRYATLDHHIVIIKYANKVSNMAYQALRTLLEKKAHTGRFIFLTSGLSSIPDPIISRCTVFRCPAPSRKMVEEMITTIAKKEGLKITSLMIQKIINNATLLKDRIDLNNVFYVLQMSFPTFAKYSNFKIPTFEIVERYMTFILTPPDKINLKFIKELRECIYEIMLNNIDLNIVYHYVSQQLIDHGHNIIHIIAESEMNLKMGNKVPVHLEAIVFNLIKALNIK